MIFEQIPVIISPVINNIISSSSTAHFLGNFLLENGANFLLEDGAYLLLE